MADNDLDYAKVTGRFALTVADGDDTGDNPDILWCDGGTVSIEPLITFVKVAGGSPGPFTAGNSVIEATINASGYLEWRGKPSVFVVDLTSPKVNPQIPAGKATHKVSFKNVTADGTKVAFPTFNVRLTADGPNGDGVNDLTTLAPVLAAPAQPIYRGEAGTGVQALEVQGGDLVYTLSDGTTETAGQLPVGPGGSDAGVASYVADQDSETAAALSASIGQYLEDHAVAGGGATIALSPSGDTTGATDQAAVAAALDQLVADSGGTLSLAAGEWYWTSQQVDIYNDQTNGVRLKIVGQGQATVIHSTATGTASSDTALFHVYGGGDIAPYPTQTEVGAVGYNWLEISDMVLVGNSHAVGLSLVGVYQGRVANVFARGFTAGTKFGAGFYMPYSIDLVLENLITFKCNYGLYAEGWFNANQIIGGWFMASLTAGVSLQGIYATGNNFWGTIFQTSGAHGLWIGPGVKATHLYGCWIEVNGHGVHIEGDDTVIDSPIFASNARDIYVTATANRTTLRSPHLGGNNLVELVGGATDVVIDTPGALTYANVIDGTAGAELTMRRAKRLVDVENTSGAAFTVPPLAAADAVSLRLTANCALTFPAPSAGQQLDLTLVQGSGGNRTVTWPATVLWPGGTAPTLSTAAGKRDRFRFSSDDGNYWYATTSALGYTVPGGGGSSFDPTTITGLTAWYDATQIPSISDGASLASWPDKSGNNRPLTQDTAAARPTFYGTTGAKMVSGKPAVWFDGGDILATGEDPGSAFSLAHPATVYLAIRRDVTADGFVMDGSGNNNRLAIFIDGGKASAFSGAQVEDPTALGTGTHKLTAVYNTTSSILRRNGTQVAAGNTGSQSLTRLQLGGNQGGQASYQGAICEVLIYSGAHNTTQMGQVEAYLTAKWG